jgi:hypothetical protein
LQRATGEDITGNFEEVANYILESSIFKMTLELILKLRNIHNDPNFVNFFTSFYRSKLN